MSNCQKTFEVVSKTSLSLSLHQQENICGSTKTENFLMPKYFTLLQYGTYAQHYLWDTYMYVRIYIHTNMRTYTHLIHATLVFTCTLYADITHIHYLMLICSIINYHIVEFQGRKFYEFLEILYRYLYLRQYTYYIKMLDDMCSYILGLIMQT